MKLTLMFLIISILSTTATASAQRVSIALDNAKVEKALAAITDQTGLSVAYSGQVVDLSRKVTLHFTDAEVTQVLDKLTAGTSLGYEVKNGKIYLFDANSNKAAPNQQSKKVNGVVMDSKGEPIIGANVIEKENTRNGTITDVKGSFSLNVASGTTLVISYIGYVSAEISVKDKSSVAVTLKEDSGLLDEVVVVGYGTMRKSDVTGSVSIAKGEDMLKTQSFNALDNLRGKVSGVNIYSNSGQPGGASRVLIRGIGTIQSSSDPLYIVDGVAMEDFKFLNPNDIERVEVLKDASSSAIYGARGANGVIMVTTKRGSKGGGTTVNYSASVSLGTMAKYMDVLDANEFMAAYKQGLENANRWYGKNYSTDLKDHFSDPRLFTNEAKPLYNTDWQREATRNTVSHNHQLSIQQGGEKSSVGAFINYTDQEGLMLNNYMKRLNAKFTYDSNPTKWLSTGFNLLVNHTWTNENEETGGGSHVPRRSMIEIPSFLPVKFPNGEWSTSTSVSDPLGLELFPNPVHLMTTQERLRYRTQTFGL